MAPVSRLGYSSGGKKEVVGREDGEASEDDGNAEIGGIWEWGGGDWNGGRWRKVVDGDERWREVGGGGILSHLH